MAINQRFHYTPGSTPMAILEQPTEPGTPSQFWTGVNNVWSNNPTMLPMAPCPPIQGVFFFQVASAVAVLFPNLVYQLHIVDSNSPYEDKVVDQRPVALVNGDDGGLGFPVVEIPLNGFLLNGLTGTLVITGAWIVPAPTPAPSPAPSPAPAALTAARRT
jgi:hypothetical protein